MGRRTFFSGWRASTRKRGRSSSQRAPPSVKATAGKEKAQKMLSSASGGGVLAGIVPRGGSTRGAIAMKGASTAGVMAAGGSVARNGPRCWYALLRTQREASRRKDCMRGSTLATRTSGTRALETQTSDSAQALRTPQMSSSASNKNEGRRRAAATAGPTTRHTASMFSAVALRTRKTGSRARCSSSEHTNCSHNSGPRLTASSLSRTAAVMRMSSASSLWARCTTMVSSRAPRSAGLSIAATVTSDSPAAIRTSGWMSTTSLARLRNTRSTIREYPSSPPCSCSMRATPRSCSARFWRTTNSSSLTRLSTRGSRRSRVASKP
mmetsp:Transcript_23390/g.88815  ORF Transcript_23390/g.88815 Transcript_23390/m.88815 type:complete len:323 (+) Transcript_23390:1668-2636(+)